jgi:ribonuclease HII
VVAPGLVRIDGNRCPVLPMRSEAVIGGDATVPLISAASILAKVTRDRMLVDLHAQHPEYGFDAHAGYSTPQHLAALRQHGPTIHHRHSFEPVRVACGAFGVVAREYAVPGSRVDDVVIKGSVLLSGGSWVPVPVPIQAGNA